MQTNFSSRYPRTIGSIDDRALAGIVHELGESRVGLGNDGETHDVEADRAVVVREHYGQRILGDVDGGIGDGVEQAVERVFPHHCVWTQREIYSLDGLQRSGGGDDARWSR